MVDPLLAELAALRGEILSLRLAVTSLVEALAREPLVREPMDPAAAGPRQSTTPTAHLLARRNAERLNSEVLRRTSQGVDPSGDNEVDLLIDRLHDLVDPSGP